MFSLGVLLAVACTVGAQQCFNGGVLGGSQLKKCYHFVYSPQTYVDAEAVCGAFSGQLASVSNAFEQSLIFGNARHRFVLNDYWIGLNDMTGSGTWQWSDGTESNFTNWIPGLPSKDDGDDCAAVRLNNGQWYNTNCDTDKKYFVCQVDPVTPEPSVNATLCPLSSEFELGRERCLHFIPSSQTFSEAELTCGSVQGALVSISDAKDGIFVTGRARVRMSRQDYWIGLNKMFNDKEWQWADDTSPTYFNWASGFPSTDVSKNCVAARATKGNWYNLECESVGKSFICESVPVVPEPPTTPAPKCPPKDGEWVYFWKTDSWYKSLHFSPPKTWNICESECVALGSHLTSIHSDEENMFVLGVSGTAHVLAIGLHSMSGLSVFEWSDGTRTNYTNWAVGQPSGEGLCSYEYPSFIWYSFPCEMPVHYAAVCKRPNI